MPGKVRKSPLSRNQKRALAALVEYPTITAAAEAINLNEKTLRRYLADPTFRWALAQQQGQLLSEATRILLAGQRSALKKLEYLENNAESESIQLRASLGWLRYSQSYAELESIELRLARLEEELNVRLND